VVAWAVLEDDDGRGGGGGVLLEKENGKDEVVGVAAGRDGVMAGSGPPGRLPIAVGYYPDRKESSQPNRDRREGSRQKPGETETGVCGSCDCGRRERVGVPGVWDGGILGLLLAGRRVLQR
jgi:hypothetical protein